MPTFNQLVRKGREQVTYKSTSPAMQKGLNTLKNRETDQSVTTSSAALSIPRASMAAASPAPSTAPRDPRRVRSKRNPQQCPVGY